MSAFASQLTALCAGVLLVTLVLLVWRRSLRSAVVAVAVQGVGLAGLVVGVGLVQHEAEMFAVAGLVLGLKAGLVPWVLERGVRRGGVDREEALLNPTAGLLLVVVTTTLAYLVSRPVVAALETAPVAGLAQVGVPVGLAMVLVGFLLLVTRRRAVSQLVGFLTVDNGIATVAFLTTGGVPLLIELGTSFELLLIVLILAVLTGRIRSLAGPGAFEAMRELRD
jgi:hydrogenase-4 component E